MTSLFNVETKNAPIGSIAGAFTSKVMDGNVL